MLPRISLTPLIQECSDEADETMTTGRDMELAGYALGRMLRLGYDYGRVAISALMVYFWPPQNSNVLVRPLKRIRNPCA